MWRSSAGAVGAIAAELPGVAASADAGPPGGADTPGAAGAAVGTAGDAGGAPQASSVRISPPSSALGSQLITRSVRIRGHPLRGRRALGEQRLFLRRLRED